MKSTVMKRAVIAGLAALGMASVAQAADFQAVQGTNVVFYYDADVWGLNSFTVTGNSISFNPYDFDLSVTVRAPSATKTTQASIDSNASLVVVANSGYKLTGGLDVGVRGSASIGNGSVWYSATGDINTGTFSGNAFTTISNVGSYSGYLSAGSGSLDASFSQGGNARLNNIGLSTNLFMQLKQVGTGTSTAKLTDFSYGFAVTAVPEPETYMMLVGGLGLVAFAARRRKQQA